MTDFVLREGLRWEPGEGYFILDHHLRRLASSAAHFGFRVDIDAVRERLHAYAEDLAPPVRKVKLELSADGTIALVDEPAKPSTEIRVALATEPVDSTYEFLRHKTSRREVYERALVARPQVREVLHWNERRELTESTNANLVLVIEGRKLTPAAQSGLLPGTFRAHLLEKGEISEAVLPLESLGRAREHYLINSVRRWYPFQVVGR